AGVWKSNFDWPARERSNGWNGRYRTSARRAPLNQTLQQTAAAIPVLREFTALGAAAAAELNRSYGHLPSAEASRIRRNPASQPRTPAIKKSIGVPSSPLSTEIW